MDGEGYGDRVSVRDFGAVGDGVQDDSDAILRAFRAARNLAEKNKLATFLGDGS